MRVTDSMLSSIVTRNTRNALGTYFDSLTRISSGKRLQRQSQAPAEAAGIVRMEDMLDRLDAMKTNRATVQADFAAADANFQQAQSVLADTLELAISMSTDFASAPDRAAAAARAQGLSEQMLALVNQVQPNGNYLYAGVADGSPGYAADGTYLGSMQNRSVEVAPGVMVEATFSAADSFGVLGSGTSAFDPFAGLITALQNNDLAGIQTSIDDVQGSIDRMRISQSRLGTQMNMLDDMGDLSEEIGLTLQTRLSSEADTDIFAESTVFTAASDTLARLTAVSQRVIQLAQARFIG